jgi:hypothetical protein
MKRPRVFGPQDQLLTLADWAGSAIIGIYRPLPVGVDELSRLISAGASLSLG